MGDVTGGEGRGHPFIKRSRNQMEGARQPAAVGPQGRGGAEAAKQMGRIWAAGVGQTAMRLRARASHVRETIASWVNILVGS